MNVSSESRFGQWKYVEVGAFKTWLDRDTGELVSTIVRDLVDRENKIPRYYEWGDEVERYRKRNNNFGIYTSFFRKKEPELDSTMLGSLYFDLDSDRAHQAYKELKVLYKFISSQVNPDFIKVYFTGDKGFHLEVEAVPLGISPSFLLPRYFRFIAETLSEQLGLETVDFVVYDQRRMWRLPNSIHQKTKLHKIPLTKEDIFSSLDDILKKAESQQPESEQCFVLDYDANWWYKQWLLEFESDQERKFEEARQKREELFNQYGDRLLKGKSSRYVNKVWNGSLKQIQEAGRAKEEDESISRNTVLSRQAFKLFILFIEEQLDIGPLESSLRDAGLAVGLPVREVEKTLESAKRAATNKVMSAA